MGRYRKCISFDRDSREVSIRFSLWTGGKINMRPLAMPEKRRPYENRTSRMNRVACAILYRNGEVLLGRRSLYSSTYPNCWDFIGGHVEKGESLLEALTRELGEELSIVPTSATLIKTIAEPDPATNGEAVYYVFEVLGWEGEPTMLSDEHSELKWFSVANACSLPNLTLAAYVPVLKRLSARQISN